MKMGNELINGIERTREADCHVAALLSSALIARTTHPSGTGAALEAANAVNLYRCVLAALAQERDGLGVSASPLVESANMHTLGVSRHDGAKYRYKTFLYDRLEDALNYARIDRERAD